MYIITPPLGMKEGIPAAPLLSWCLVYLRARPPGAGMWGSLLHSEEEQAGRIVKTDSETSQSRSLQSCLMLSSKKVLPGPTPSAWPSPCGCQGVECSLQNPWRHLKRREALETTLQSSLDTFSSY